MSTETSVAEDALGAGGEEPAGPGLGLGVRLRRVRTERSLSVRELARRAGCSPSLISQIERGHSAPSAQVLYALANELRVSLDYLFGFGEVTPAARAGSDHDPATPAERGRENDRQRDDGVSYVTNAWGRAKDSSGTGIIQRAQSRRRIELSSGVRWERLTPDADGLVDFLEVVYQPGGHSSDNHKAVRHEGREYLLILEGTLHADIGFETYALHAGDSAAFDPLIPHQFRNETDQVVRALSFIVQTDNG
ncbi:transcriptional regulator with XRE-family HTH domain/quercetin dioxygenase-like cupin family protein [Thermocatellispora tengchongensis]|uniref:Transcriptional regulator with XRE-family HTH domain/quercetin dioxygenase-like cupin family protein n=1 Tax=Thermocatellispora tengchongensis TaxID=1073253 RepID=A0A840PJI9_9ACTN|nr:helix-turn-helix domain-containing protein [Thermocatellispora tengchongensis]MBB5137257.1 transcriptional regulator with XRE-family HTH domain/quercetin dioxygenase-like cupin family protein [Thermocatellispora tengchongensis]